MADTQIGRVISKDGLRGRMQDPSSLSRTDTDRVLVQLENGQQVTVPKQLLTLQPDGNYYLPFALNELEPVSDQSTAAPDTVLTVPVLREELSVQKRPVETGRTRIFKTIAERQETIDEPLMREEVVVEHVPVHQVWSGPPPSVRYEGDTLVIPLLEEVFVVEKRLMLKEEVHVRRQQTTVREPQQVTLRSEEVHVERVNPPDEREDSLISNTSSGRDAVGSVPTAQQSTQEGEGNEDSYRLV